eukprot:3301962-Alexandrium_andersonii.AAC.1
MEVFAFRDVNAHLAEFEALMASDNFASAFALAEDEFGLASRLAACARNIKPAPGTSVWDATRARVAPLLGNRWSEPDLVRLYNYTASTEETRVEFAALFARFMFDAKEMRVSPAFFQRLSTLD